MITEYNGFEIETYEIFDGVEFCGEYYWKIFLHDSIAHCSDDYGISFDTEIEAMLNAVQFLNDKYL